MRICTVPPHYSLHCPQVVQKCICTVPPHYSLHCPQVVQKCTSQISLRMAESPHDYARASSGVKTPTQVEVWLTVRKPMTVNIDTVTRETFVEAQLTPT